MSLSTSRLSFQDAKTTGAASAPDSRAPHPQAGPVPGTHRPFHERVKRTKRPPRCPRRAAVPRPDGHLSAHKPIPQGHARLPPAPRPTPPRYLSQMESSSQAPWSSVSGEQEERELKDGLLRLAAVAVEGRPRTPGERTSPARERAAQRGRTPPGSALGRQARLADASPDGGPAAARSPRAPPPPRSPAAAPPPLRRWTADSHRDTLLGELLGPRPHAASALRGAARCADRDAGAPLRWLSGELQPPRV